MGNDAIGCSVYANALLHGAFGIQPFDFRGRDAECGKAVTGRLV
jgi:hypothetical protein